MMTDHYTFTMHYEDGTVLSLTGNKITLFDILDDFRSYLRGCTFDEKLVDRILHLDEEPYNGN